MHDMTDKDLASTLNALERLGEEYVTASTEQQRESIVDAIGRMIPSLTDEQLTLLKRVRQRTDSCD